MNREHDLGKVITIFLGFVAVALGLHAWQGRGVAGLGGDRKGAEIGPSEQDVVARLWEDPLQAIQGAVDPKNIPPGKNIFAEDSPNGLKSAIKQRLVDNKVRLLVMSIPETPFPDDLEVRLRMRYAVQMALAAENYAPENRNGLGYFVVSSNSSAIFVPYEWFAQRNSASQALVIWLPEIFLGSGGRDSLYNLTLLLTSLVDPKTNKFAGMYLLGPRSSDTLKSIVTKTNAESNYLEPLRGKFAIYSPQATAPDFVVGVTNIRSHWSEARAGLAEQLAARIEPSASNHWRYFENFIAPDDQLTDLIARELQLRGINFAANGSASDQILILAEADTSYGQSLPLALRASLRSLALNGINLHPTNSHSSTPGLIATITNDDSGILIHRYLRGLDQQKGHVATAKQETRTPIKSPEEAFSAVLTKEGAMALGESQLDYVDRLAAEIQSRAPRIKAVGILGADLYDKLILIKSLRQKFRHALFFTTDLDARMWHPDHLAFTRNVVVASAYALNDIESEFKTASFRDTYQTAVFRACVAALRKLPADGKTAGPLPEPSIYEIGRTGPHLLLSRNTVSQEKSAAPRPGWKVGWYLMASSLVFLLGSLYYAADLRPWFHNIVFPWLKRGRTLMYFVILGVGAFSVFKICSPPYVEPFLFNEGISIWPTEIVRLLMILLVVITVDWAWRRHVRRRAEILEKFFISQKLPDHAVHFDDAVRFDALREAWPAANVRADDVAKKTEAEAIDAFSVFAIYSRKAAFHLRLTRALLGTIAYLLFGFGLIFLVDGGMPGNLHIRGEDARKFDFRILIVSVIAFIFLVFYVLDAVRLTQKLLACMCGRKTKWPENVLPSFQAKYKLEALDDQDLSYFLDVQFAALKSAETSTLILLPFLLLIVLVVSRNSLFDNWSWPGTLFVIYGLNLLLAISSWAILRHSAGTIRAEAQHQFDKSLEGKHHALVNETFAQNRSFQKSQGLRAQIAALRRVQRLVAEEKSGAYSTYFSDPAVLAMLIPSSAITIILLIVQVLFGGI